MKHKLELRLPRLLAGLRVMKTATTFAWALAVALCAQSVSAATRTVTNLNDGGQDSLRDAILASAPGDTIDFSSGGTIVLTNELVIGRNLTIAGPAAGLTVSGNNRSRVFKISGGTVVLSNLVVSSGRMVGTNAPIDQVSPGGSVQGGGILNSGNLSLINCTLHANEAVGGQGGRNIQLNLGGDGGSASGGAICNFGSLTLLNCTLDSNFATGGAGGGDHDLGYPGKGGNAYGGAIYSTGMVSLVSCTLNRCSATGGPGGVAARMEAQVVMRRAEACSTVAPPRSTIRFSRAVYQRDLGAPGPYLPARTARPLARTSQAPSQARGIIWSAQRTAAPDGWRAI